MKELKEAEFYKPLPNNRVQCELCPHFCILEENKISPCGSRILLDNKLRTISYGQAIARNIDPIEKKPLNQFHPGTLTYSIGTPGCNLHCKNCQNKDISQAKNSTKSHFYISPQDIVNECLRNKLPSISYTYTEPTIFYEYMIDIAILAKQKGIMNILVSNGYINEPALTKLIPYLDAANIDMKVFNDTKYRELTGGNLNPVLNSILNLHNNGVWVEITLLLIPGISDDNEDLKNFFSWIISNKLENQCLHINRFFPYYKLQNIAPTSIERLFEVKDMAISTGLKNVHVGNVSGSK
jgi:pyruvate formate lyase activating enzyme